MQSASSSPLLRAEARQRTVRLAWLILSAFFLLFSLLLAWSIYQGWHLYANATNQQPGTLVVRAPAELVTWQPCGRTIFQRANDRQTLQPCDTVRIVETAGYGQAATIELLDRSTLDLWAGSELALVQSETTRWNNRSLTVVLRQTSGYVRYDLRADQVYRQVLFQVQVGDATIELEPGGSYSIEIRPTERQARLLDENGAQLAVNWMADAAVRKGRAWIRGSNGDIVQLVEGQRAEVNPTGAPERPIPARWELIADGDFNQFSEAEYNNTTLIDRPTLPRATSWQVFSVGAAGTTGGYFRLAPTCRPPETSFNCTPAERRTAAWFYRTGGQTSGFTTGIQQNFGVNGSGLDISEYRSLAFSVWVRVLNQSLAGSGVQGSECPVMIRFLAKRNAPTDDEHERVLCAYLTPNQGEAARWPGLIYRPLEAYRWYRVTFDLRDAEWFPDYRYLRGVQIYANGHDYDTRVTGVSLIGEQ